MSQPTVCCICLTADRPELTKKAVEAFRAQTYENKRLLIWDTGELNVDLDSDGDGGGEVVHIPAPTYQDPPLTIGALRNAANAFWTEYPILIHWDSDDWSHPNRIAEQVTILQASGADCVGFNEILFWRTPRCRDCGDEANTNCGDDPMGDVSAHRPIVPGEAWLYSNPRSNYALGTSLCYWRKTWEAKPFEDIPRPGDVEGEDGRFIRGLNVKAVSSLAWEFVDARDKLGSGAMWKDPTGLHDMHQCFPRMIARIHSGNTSDQYRDIAQSGNWKRVEHWDARLREIMQ